MSEQDQDLFEVHMLDDEAPSVLVITDNVESDYAFEFFAEVTGGEDMTDVSHEDLLNSMIDYCLLLLDPDLVEQLPPTITRVIYSESGTIITLSLDEEVVSYIAETYPDSDSIIAQLGIETDDDDDQDDEEVEDEDGDPDWTV